MDHGQFARTLYGAHNAPLMFYLNPSIKKKKEENTRLSTWFRQGIRSGQYMSPLMSHLFVGGFVSVCVWDASSLL